MGIKWTTQGALIYSAMGAYLLGALAGVAAILADRRGPDRGCREVRGTAWALYAAGFALAAASFIYRGVDVKRIPLKDLFEVCLCMGMLLFPLSLLARFALRVGGETWDMVIGAVVLFPAGFVFDAERHPLMPALQSPLFAPHVATYMLAYVIMAKAFVQAVGQLATGQRPPPVGLVGHETGTYRMICLGFPVLTIGLVLGAVWGKLAWGDYWNWDPKELWSLVSWLVYVAYFHFRAMYGRRHAKVNAGLAVAGMGAIVITLLWVNLSRVFSGLHSYAT